MGGPPIDADNILELLTSFNMAAIRLIQDLIMSTDYSLIWRVT